MFAWCGCLWQKPAECSAWGKLSPCTHACALWSSARCPGASTAQLHGIWAAARKVGPSVLSPMQLLRPCMRCVVVCKVSWGHAAAACKPSFCAGSDSYACEELASMLLPRPPTCCRVSVRCLSLVHPSYC